MRGESFACGIFYSLVQLLVETNACGRSTESLILLLQCTVDSGIVVGMYVFTCGGIDIYGGKVQ